MSKDKTNEVVFFQSSTMVGVQFMDVMGDYLTRQQDDPNFDPRTAIYDLYDDLVTLYLSSAAASIASRINPSNPQDNE